MYTANHRENTKKLKRGTANKPIMGIHGENKDYPIFPKEIRKRWEKE